MVVTLKSVSHHENNGSFSSPQTHSAQMRRVFYGSGNIIVSLRAALLHLLFSKKCPETMSAFAFCSFISYFEKLFAELRSFLLVCA